MHSSFAGAGCAADQPARLRAALVREVPGLIIDAPADEWGWIARSRAALAENGQTIDHPQPLVVIDRNPAVQQMRIVLARTGGPWESLVGSKVSTGQRGRRDYYVTPTGVFHHTDAILIGEPKATPRGALPAEIPHPHAFQPETREYGSR